MALLCLPFGALAQSTGAPVYNVGDSDIETRLTVLERKVNNRAEMQHRLQQQIDTMQNELDELRGAVEVHTNQLQKVLDRQRELYLEIDKRVESLKQSGFSGAASNGPATTTVDNTPAATPVTPAVTQPSGLSESDAYEKAVNLILKSREYDKAIPEFQAFIERFPDSSYAPNAHYWLGQLLFNKQQWQDAAAQFEVVVNKFVDSAKRPDALLKLGVIAEKVGNQARAKALFEEVINNYPNSSARKLAEARL
ncbi:tol-pal system protein YbgF [Alteromonas lipolytica]|uniref:Cell division coordinator CpoB n=1 Tax=Alteromonas lipolytica TaxID=1856405 RepID=A0A1E8FJJ4_9ALTE|nr:tol-pal system protein YbgF [Alteromonas lipolytica]OFI36111.1 tol-pal system protein YbgF [Alteromonas lipolytica]